jgi:hypothetical protein
MVTRTLENHIGQLLRAIHFIDRDAARSASDNNDFAS